MTDHGTATTAIDPVEDCGRANNLDVARSPSLREQPTPRATTALAVLEPPGRQLGQRMNARFQAKVRHVRTCRMQTDIQPGGDFHEVLFVHQQQENVELSMRGFRVRSFWHRYMPLAEPAITLMQSGCLRLGA